jgi:hypothetical protein
VRSRCALALVLLLAAAPSLAQNRYFADGANGLTARAGWVTADDADGLGGSVVLTFNGRFDLGVGYVAPEIEISPGVTQEWQEISPSAAISVVRPREHFPVGVDVAASYTTVKFAGTLNDLAGGDAQTLGLDVSGRFGNERFVTLVPAFGIHYRRTEAWVRDSVDDPKRTAKESGPMIAVEFAFLVADRFIIVPGTVAFEGDTTWSLMGGFALSLQ